MLRKVLLAVFLATAALPASAEGGLQVEKAILTHAPDVPPPITRDYPAHVVVDLDVEEVINEIAPGVKYTEWTFGGAIPGMFIRIRQGDEVEFHLRNRSGNSLPHNIDIHAVTGPGGGAKVSLTPPGQESIFEWKALRSGIYVYHCATTPVPMHLSNGMYGMILVEPEGGLPKVDREYYLMQGEFYTQREEPDPDAAHNYTGSETPGVSQGDIYTFSFTKMLTEDPDYVLWNGREDSLTGPNALQAKVGDKVRLFVGNAGVAHVMSFHIIGAQLQKVYTEGSLDSPPILNIQNHVIPAGGAAMIETTFEVPGDYPLLDHALDRSFSKGGLAMLHVSGAERADLYRFVARKPLGDAVAAVPAADHRLSVDARRTLSQCMACHDITPKHTRIFGPPLWGVYGRKPLAKGLPFDKLDRAALDRWLRGPSAVKPNTLMTYSVPDDKERAQVIDCLETLK